MTPGKQFGWLLTTAVVIVILFGPLVSQRDQAPAVQVVAAAPIVLSVAPTLAELEVASAQALDQTDKVSPEETLKLIEEVLDGAEVNFALAQFDAWLNGLETRQLILKAKDLDEDLKDLVEYAREVGVTEEDIKKRLERLDKLRDSHRI